MASRRRYERMGCLSEEEREKILVAFWQGQRRALDLFVVRMRRVREAASLEKDPYRRRLLSWAAENWGMVETLAYEDSPGLYGTAYAALPEDLRVEMEEMRVSADPHRILSDEDKGRLELQVLNDEERQRTSSPCPETEARLREIHEKRRLRGERWITEDQIKEIHREITQASGVHDPDDLPG
jgi:hypothetical protein